MATAKKAAPAKTSKKPAKTAAAEDDDLLATKSKKGAKAKPAAKGKAAKADAGDDDMLATKGSKKTAKATAARKAEAKKPRKAAEDDGTTGTRDDVRAVILKTKKATSVAEIAQANNFNVRMVRRTARAMRDEGTAVITKEGTAAFVRKA